MKEPRILADILKDYFQNSDESLAVAFREHAAKNPSKFSKQILCPFAEQMPLSDWLDNQDVMHLLHISPRTLQSLRSNGILPFSRISNKLYYKRSDIQRILQDNYTMIKIRNYGNDK
jgi:hypothetical protein